KAPAALDEKLQVGERERLRVGRAGGIRVVQRAHQDRREMGLLFLQRLRVEGAEIDSELGLPARRFLEALVALALGAVDPAPAAGGEWGGSRPPAPRARRARPRSGGSGARTGARSRRGGTPSNEASISTGTARSSAAPTDGSGRRSCDSCRSGSA